MAVKKKHVGVATPPPAEAPKGNGGIAARTRELNALINQLDAGHQLKAAGRAARVARAIVEARKRFNQHTNRKPLGENISAQTGIMLTWRLHEAYTTNDAPDCQDRAIFTLIKKINGYLVGLNEKPLKREEP